jgi:hypothetical protein
MSYGLNIWNSAGALRLSLTSKTALFANNYTGTYVTGSPVSVGVAPTGFTMGIVDNTNMLDETLTYGAGNVSFSSGYNGNSYNFSTYLL